MHSLVLVLCLYNAEPTAQHVPVFCFAFDFGIVNVHKTIIWMVMDHSGHDSNLADEIWPAYILNPLHKTHWQYKFWQLPFRCWEVLVMVTTNNGGWQTKLKPAASCDRHSWKKWILSICRPQKGGKWVPTPRFPLFPSIDWWGGGGSSCCRKSVKCLGVGNTLQISVLKQR